MLRVILVLASNGEELSQAPKDWEESCLGKLRVTNRNCPMPRTEVTARPRRNHIVRADSTYRFPGLVGLWKSAAATQAIGRPSG